MAQYLSLETGIYPKEQLIVVDNTALETFRTCPMKYSLRIHQGLVVGKNPLGGAPPRSAALEFGGAIHKALDTLYLEESLEAAISVFYKQYTPPPQEKKRTLARGEAVLREYFDKWVDKISTYKAVMCELAFQHELGLAQTQKSGEWKVIYGGLVDKIVRLPNGELWCIDHKTSTLQTEAIALSYEMSNQFQGYLWGAVAGTQLSKVNGLYVDLLLIHPKNNDFMHHPIPYSENRMKQWKAGILHTAELVLKCWEDMQWPQFGQSACVQYHQLCAYYDICYADQPEQRESIKKSFFLHKPWKVLDAH